MKRFSVWFAVLAAVAVVGLVGCSESGEKNMEEASKQNLGTETGEQPQGSDAATGPKMKEPE